MSGLRQLQQAFLGHLLDQTSDIERQIQSTPDCSAQQRLSIYASAYRLRLKEALSTDYERLHTYLGDVLFEQLMDAYIDHHHSHHPSLRYYGQYFKTFLARQLPFSKHPELVEIAGIEQAFNHSFDAANCASDKTIQLEQVAPESWPVMQLKFHAAVQLINCEYNSFPIWVALSQERTPPTLVKETISWVVWRKSLVSRYRALPEAEAHVLQIAMQGGSFGDICEALLDYFDEEQTPRQAVFYLQTWINEKMVCALIV